MMELQPRDKEILSKLNRYGVLSTRQLKDIFFKGIASSTVLRRIRKLEKSNMIARVHGLDEGLCAWTLAPKGASVIGTRDTFSYSNRNAIEHEVTLSALRMSLESVGLGNDWITEMELKRRSFAQNRGRERREQVIPDGIFMATHNDKPVAIAVELELHTKSSNRYEKLFRDYLTMNAIFQIWYFVPSCAVGERILSEWSRASKKYGSSGKPYLGYTILEEVLKNPRSMQLHQNGAKPAEVWRYFRFKPIQEPAPTQSNGVAHTPAHTVSSANVAAA